MLLGLMVTLPTMAAEPSPLLVDDFTRPDGRSALGTGWQGFSDRVMGGRSDLAAGLVESDIGPALRMRGRVRLDNNGGFIQVRLPLSQSGVFDARTYRTVRLRVRGSPGAYYLHLRSADTRLPWQYYRARLPVSAAWQTIDIAFESMAPQALAQPLDLSRLQSLAIVAYGEAFDADIEVGRITLEP